ncbi:MmpS family transport accessory protein [Actinoplanes auranticolor]
MHARGQSVGATAQNRLWRRRRRSTLVVGIAVVLVVATAAVVWVYGRQAIPEAGAPQPSASVATTPSRAPRVAAVTYEVSGEGRVDIWYTDPARTETTTLLNQQLPWRVELAPHAVSFVQITARRTKNGFEGQPVRALVDGVEVCNGTNVGGYMKSTCSELVPPL